MNLPRNCLTYQNGVERCLDFAMKNAFPNEMILCPCTECGNGIMRTKNEVREHLVVVGFIKAYTHWVAHRERKFSSSSTPRSTPIEDSVVNEHGDMEEMFMILLEFLLMIM